MTQINPTVSDTVPRPPVSDTDVYRLTSLGRTRRSCSTDFVPLDNIERMDSGTMILLTNVDFND